MLKCWVVCGEALVDKDVVKEGMTFHVTTVMLNEVWSERELLCLTATTFDSDSKHM